MSDIESRLVDLIKFSSGQKPIDFEDTFKLVLQDKVATAIENKKIEMATRMFSPEQDLESDEDVESDESDESDEQDLENTEIEDQEDGEST